MGLHAFGDRAAVLRRAVVLRKGEPAGGAVRLRLRLLEGPLSTEEVDGICYVTLGDAPEEGEKCVANTLGLEMGLGTGGVAIVAPATGAEPPENRDHFVKLPYTPLQFPALYTPVLKNLSGVPVVVLSLHSQLAPAAAAAAGLRPGCRTAFVWGEGGALGVGFSDTVRSLREKGLLSSVVSCGACFGGDIEAPNIYAGLLACGEVDLVVAGIGPGVVGSATAYGHGGVSAAMFLNAACALEGEPVLAPRISMADPRERHRGISHHTRAVLGAALSGVRVALPQSAAGRLSPQGLPDRHGYIPVRAGASGLQERFGLSFESMGRGYDMDPALFDAAAGAVALAFGEAV